LDFAKHFASGVFDPKNRRRGPKRMRLSSFCQLSIARRQRHWHTECNWVSFEVQWVWIHSATPGGQRRGTTDGPRNPTCRGGMLREFARGTRKDESHRVCGRLSSCCTVDLERRGGACSGKRKQIAVPKNRWFLLSIPGVFPQSMGKCTRSVHCEFSDSKAPSTTSPARARRVTLCSMPAETTALGCPSSRCQNGTVSATFLRDP